MGAALIPGALIALVLAGAGAVAYVDRNAAARVEAANFREAARHNAEVNRQTGVLLSGAVESEALARDAQERSESALEAAKAEGRRLRAQAVAARERGEEVQCDACCTWQSPLPPLSS